MKQTSVISMTKLESKQLIFVNDKETQQLQNNEAQQLCALRNDCIFIIIIGRRW